MAGHRRPSGKPARPAKRTTWWIARLRSAPTAEAQFAAAADWYRAAAARSGNAGTALHEASTYLAERAAQLEAA